MSGWLLEDKKEVAEGTQAHREVAPRRSDSSGLQSEGSIPPFVQAKAGSAELEGDASRPRTAGYEAMVAVAQRGGGPGRVLPERTRQTMEESLGADLRSVRVLEGSGVGKLGAKAVTRGEEVHFAPGEFQPETSSGKELLGHELAHVLQQRSERAPTGTYGAGGEIAYVPALEREADAVGRRVARGERVGDVTGRHGVSRSGHSSQGAQASRAMLRLGARGDAVETLQELLHRHGLGVSKGGVFDSATEAAVKTFQQKHRLEPSGVVDEATWAALEGMVKVESKAAAKPAAPAKKGE